MFTVEQCSDALAPTWRNSLRTTWYGQRTASVYDWSSVHPGGSQLLQSSVMFCLTSMRRSDPVAPFHSLHGPNAYRQKYRSCRTQHCPMPLHKQTTTKNVPNRNNTLNGWETIESADSSLACVSIPRSLTYIGLYWASPFLLPTSTLQFRIPKPHCCIWTIILNLSR